MIQFDQFNSIILPLLCFIPLQLTCNPKLLHVFIETIYPNIFYFIPFITKKLTPVQVLCYIMKSLLFSIRNELSSRTLNNVLPIEITTQQLLMDITIPRHIKFIDSTQVIDLKIAIRKNLHN